MLAVSVDPSASRGGIVFAALTQNEATDGPGLLRAFDAVTLHEVWNNQDENYQCEEDACVRSVRRPHLDGSDGPEQSAHLDGTTADNGSRLVSRSPLISFALQRVHRGG
jgi:hypothetical protein